MPRQGEGIYHRKDGLWEARYVKGLDARGKKKYGSVYAHSYREAKEKRLDLIGQMAALPQSVSTRRLTVNELISEWLYINRGRIKENTYYKYHAIFENHIQKELGGIPIIFLTPIILRQYTEEKQKQGLGSSTVNNILAFLSTCLKYAHRQHGTPLMDIIYLKRPQKEMRVLSQSEQATLTEFLITDMDVYKFGVFLALYTGIRVGELCALTWGDLKDETLKITKTMYRMSKGKGNGTEILIGDPKTGSSNRVIPLPSFLSPYVERFRKEDGVRVLSTSRQDYVEPRVIQYQFQKYIRETNLPKANFHCLRHSFATRCMEAGFDVRSLSEILGHSSVSITLNRYVHSSLELKTNNMEKLSVFL